MQTQLALSEVLGAEPTNIKLQISHLWKKFINTCSVGLIELLKEKTVLGLCEPKEVMQDYLYSSLFGRESSW